MATSKPNQYSAYDREYQARPEQVAKRVARNAARREAIRDGDAKKGDGKDVDHVKQLALGGSTSKSNTRVVPASVNRAKNKRPGGR